MIQEKYQLAVIMPAFNEEGSIANVVNNWGSELKRLGINFRIHVYDDGSKDSTVQILQEISKTNKNLTIHVKPNSGHGPTIIRGYRENSNAEWIAQLDSDDEIGVENFEELWRKRNGYHILIGKRVFSKRPLFRNLVTLLSRLLVWVLYGRTITDVNCPFRLMKSEVFKELFFSLLDNTFAPNVIISGYASLKGLKVYEVPVVFRNRQKGKVSLNKTRLIKASLRSFLEVVLYRVKLYLSDSLTNKPLEKRFFR